MAIERSVRASEAGIKKADELRIKKRWKRQSAMLVKESFVSLQTIKRFWARKDLIHVENFSSIFKALGTDDWEQYVDQSIEASSEFTPEPPERIVDGVPKLGAFYGREHELETLSQSILEHNIQVIGLLGMGGIGKTALAAKLVQRVQDRFDAVIWRSLRGTPPLSDFLIDLLETLSPDSSPVPNRHCLIDELIERLTQQRVLLVFDSWQSILGGESSGAYRPEYQDYSELLGQLWQQTHRSCIILTSREKQAAFTIIGTAQPHKMVGLDAAAAAQLLCSKGLICEQRHSNDLVHLYRGNPLALQLIASVIRDQFGGDVSEFLRQGTVFVDEFFIETVLQQQMEYLSEVEKKILMILAEQLKPLDRDLLQTYLPVSISTAKFLNALTSLERRSLMERDTEAGLVVYALQPMVRKYVKQYLSVLITS
jgi:hypothetical protein